MRPTLYVLLGVLLVPTVGLVGDIVTEGKFKSTLVREPPLEVASSEMVVNLNADMVDGVEGTDIYTKAEVDALVAAVDSRRAFYFANVGADGDEPLTACDTGFHMASIWEIFDVSNLRYDTVRGTTLPDSGSGPPTNAIGWVRTGYDGSTNNSPGISGCSSWSSDSAAHWGTVVHLGIGWADSAVRITPWSGDTQTCNLGAGVWCVED
jgi:hypothetical protein